MEMDGWNLYPFGTHEERLFSKGEPTALVRDAGVGSYDEPPVNQEASQAPGLSPSPEHGANAEPPTPPVTPPQVAAQPVAPSASQPVVTWTTLASTGSLFLAQSPYE